MGLLLIRLCLHYQMSMFVYVRAVLSEVEAGIQSDHSFDLTKHLRKIPGPEEGSCSFPPSHTNTLCNPYSSLRVISAAFIQISDKLIHKLGFAFAGHLQSD